MPKGKPVKLRECKFCGQLFSRRNPVDYYCGPGCQLFGRITLVGNGCWNWNGAKTYTGYGQLKIFGKSTRAHRAMYDMWHSCSTLYLRHACDNPSCINPRHLIPGTHRENMQDKVARKRSMPI